MVFLIGFHSIPDTASTINATGTILGIPEAAVPPVAIIAIIVNGIAIDAPTNVGEFETWYFPLFQINM